MHTVDTDPSLFSLDKSYKRDPEVKWNPQEANSPKSPIDYFYKAFPKSYIATILVNTNAKLAKISKIGLKEEKQAEDKMYTNCFLTQRFEGIVQFVNAKSNSTAAPVQH